MNFSRRNQARLLIYMADFIYSIYMRTLFGLISELSDLDSKISTTSRAVTWFLNWRILEG